MPTMMAPAVMMAAGPSIVMASTAAMTVGVTVTVTALYLNDRTVDFARDIPGKGVGVCGRERRRRKGWGKHKNTGGKSDH